MEYSKDLWGGQCLPEPVISEHPIVTYRFSPHFLARLVHGSQARVSHREYENHGSIAATIPATPWDALKLLLVQWQPSLDFGWLSPKMRSIITKQFFQVEETYINVIPAPPDTERMEVWRIAHMRDLPLIPVDPSQWLVSEPCTKDEIKEAREEFYKTLSSERAAWMMDWRTIYG